LSVDEVIEWADNPPLNTDGYFSKVWFRGHSQESFDLEPGVYRKAFSERAKRFWVGGKLPADGKSEAEKLERKRLNLERTIIGEFFQAGGHLLERGTNAEAYFLAQHFGVPTRLLDWSTNPLVALFMAVADDDNGLNLKENGVIYAMDATAHLQEQEDPSRKGIMTPGHPYARHAIEIVMSWAEPNKDYKPLIIPIRPDVRPGRLERQSSCFTLHAYGSKETANNTLRSCMIPANEKRKIKAMLRTLSINQFTVYNTLDRLSKEMRTCWRLVPQASP
jgi:hypothetical protein